MNVSTVDVRKNEILDMKNENEIFENSEPIENEFEINFNLHKLSSKLVIFNNNEKKKEEDEEDVKYIKTEGF